MKYLEKVSREGTSRGAGMYGVGLLVDVRVGRHDGTTTSSGA